MSQTTATETTRSDSKTGVVSSGRTTASRSVTVGAYIVGAVVIVGVFIALIAGGPADNPRPTSLGFSLNSFFVWLGGLNPLLQIPLVLIVFGIIAGVLLVLIEYAPRAGKGYFLSLIHI